MKKEEAEGLAKKYQYLCNQKVKQINTPFFVKVEDVYAMPLENDTNEDYDVYYKGVHDIKINGQSAINDPLVSLIGNLI